MAEANGGTNQQLGQAIDEAQRLAQQNERWTAHEKLHRSQSRNRDKELALRWRAHEDIHVAAHEAHAQLHEALAKGHAREHGLNDLAVSKSEVAYDKRFEAVNEFRDQLRDQAGTFASTERVETMQRDMDRRFEEHRLSITNLEKGDVKQEGRGIGQGAVIAAIVTVITVVGGLLGIVIVLSNLLTKSA